MDSKLLSRVSLVLVFVGYCFSLYFYIKLIYSIIQRNFMVLDSVAKVSYVGLLAVAIIFIILSTTLLIISLKSKCLIKLMTFIIIIFILMSVYVLKDTIATEEYTTTFDNEDRQEYISGKIVNKEIHNFMFNDNSEHYIEVETKKDLFPVKVIVKENEYESMSENERFKTKVSVLMRSYGSEPIAR